MQELSEISNKTPTYEAHDALRWRDRVALVLARQLQQPFAGLICLCTQQVSLNKLAAAVTSWKSFGASHL